MAFDVTAETMLRYYTATEKKRTSDEVLNEMYGEKDKKEGKSEEEYRVSICVSILGPGSHRGRFISG